MSDELVMTLTLELTADEINTLHFSLDQLRHSLGAAYAMIDDPHFTDGYTSAHSRINKVSTKIRDAQRGQIMHRPTPNVST